MAKINQLNVNGIVRAIDADADTTLLSVLREQLDLTGTKYGCGEGQCGACTILINGSPRRSCITPVGTVGQKQITTIEGLAKDGALHPVQEGFWECHGLQCGYCTPGMILAAAQLLQRNPRPTRDEIAHAVEGNLCRCTGYSHIIDAIEYAAKKMAKKKR